MRKQYILKNIRDLLSHGFDRTELSWLWLEVPEFRSVEDDLPRQASKAEIIKHLIEYSTRKHLFDSLLAWTKEANPARYETHQPYIIYDDDTSTASPQKTDIYSSSGTMVTNISNVNDSIIIVSSEDVIANSPSLFEKAAYNSQQIETPTKQQDADLIKPTLGIITALPKEYVAIKTLLETQEEFVVQGRGAGRRYLLGQVPAINGGKHHVVLSLADMGNNIAAARATLLLEHFPSVTAIIMTGIAGGVPHPTKTDDHVRLGDIVVSNRQGVIQYDFDKEEIRRTMHRHPPAPPSATLLEGVRLLEAAELEGQHPWLALIEQIINRLGWSRPLEEEDKLADSRQPKKIIPHPADPKRRKGQPRVFIGPIASANKLLKNPVKRDRLRDKFGVKAVEMEGSGIADATWNHEVGYLVVRGICDYCDANKGDEWQEYAAVVAAAYTVALLRRMPGQPQSDGTAKKAASSLARTTGNKN